MAAAPYRRGRSYLVFWFSFPVTQLLADQLEILFVQLSLLLAILGVALPLGGRSRFGLGAFILFLFLVFVYDEPFSDLVMLEQ